MRYKQAETDTERLTVSLRDLVDSLIKLLVLRELGRARRALAAFDDVVL